MSFTRDEPGKNFSFSFVLFSFMIVGNKHLSFFAVNIHEKCCDNILSMKKSPTKQMSLIVWRTLENKRILLRTPEIMTLTFNEMSYKVRSSKIVFQPDMKFSTASFLRRLL